MKDLLENNSLVHLQPHYLSNTKANVQTNKMHVCLLLHEKLNLGGLFDTTGCIISSTFFRTSQYSDSVVVNL